MPTQAIPPTSRLLRSASGFTVATPDGEVIMASPTADAHWVQFFQKLDSLRHVHMEEKRKTMKEEIRSVEFWRAVISECLATFFCVFLICGAHVPWPRYEPTPGSVSLTCGFAMATLTHCFGQISGSHVNPAVTVAMLITRKVSPLGALLYITAQCGGAIAGCALLFGFLVKFDKNISPGTLFSPIKMIMMLKKVILSVM
uniref:Aquaporin n=1 Tax=Strigamia maritima TaxID=126957 RepID=T1JPH8_STRMM